MLIYIFLPLSDAVLIFNTIKIISLCGIEPPPKNKKLISIVLFSAALSLLEAHSLLHNSDFHILLSIASMCIPFLFYRKFRLNYLYIIILHDFTTNIITENILMLLSSSTSGYTKIILSTFIARLCITPMILAAQKRTDPSTVKRIISQIPSYIYILILSNLYFIGFSATVNNQLSPDRIEKAYIINIFILLSILCSTAIIILLIFNVMLKKHSEDNLNRLDSQIKLQISHYEKLDRHNAEMRRFRHDYRNHLRAILSLISMDETEEAREYISNILNIEEIPKLSFDTGNCLADAILTDKSEQFSDGTIDFKGIIPDSLDNADICTVLSNALDNAIEACVACGNKHIDINSNVKQGYFVITIANPTDMENFSGKIPETTKPDPSSHGYGLISIETIARKNNGRIKLNCENGRFTLSVLMKV